MFRLKWNCSPNTEDEESEISALGTYTVSSITAENSDHEALTVQVPTNTISIQSDYLNLSLQTIQKVNTANYTQIVLFVL